MNLDDQLRSALRRREPPAGFRERVLARAGAQELRRESRRSSGAWWPWPRLSWVVAAALALALVGGGVQYQRWRRGESAKRQVLMALQIASTKLSYAQAKALKAAGAQILPNREAGAKLEAR